MSKENLDNFEAQIKDLMEQYEAPYEPEGWDQVEQELNKSSAPKKTSNTLKVSVIAASIALAVLGGYYAFFNGDNSRSTENDKEVTHRSVEEKDTKEKETTEKEKPSTSNDQKETKDQTSKESTPLDDDNTNKETSKITAKEEKDHKEEDVVSNEPSSEKEGEQEISEPVEKTEAKSHTPSDENKVVRFEATFTVNKEKACPGESFAFRPTGIDKANKEQFRFLWEFGDGTSSEKAAPSHQYEESGSYDVSLTITNKNGKTRKRNQHSLIRIYPEPNGRINERITNQGVYRPVQLEFDSENDVQEVKWDFGDNSKPQIGQSVEHRYECAGNYPISAMISNEYGCSNSVKKEISLGQETYNLLAPTAFTPNNDGRNENFLPVGLKNLDNDFHMSIYDPATGGQVFETTSKNHPWDGTIAGSGQKAKVGKTFIWKVVLFNNCGQSETYQGRVDVVDR